MKGATWLIALAVLASSCSNAPTDGKAQKKSTRKVIQRGTPKPKTEESNALTIDNFEAVTKAHARQHPGSIWVLETDMGTIEVELHDFTPVHKASIIYLTDKGYFTKTFFHRVDRDFVIQAGNTDGDDTQSRRAKMGSYTLPAELHRRDLHYTGAVAMARSYTNNPNKRSSPFEFYIVTAPTVPAPEFDATVEHYKLDLNQEERKRYLQLGGAPHLDGEHTVVGRVTKGLEVAKAINKVPTDDGEWPIENVVIQKAYIKR